MAKVKNFKTIFPAVSVPLNDDYSINEEEFRVYLRWIKSFYDQGISRVLSATVTQARSQASQELRERESLRSAQRSAAIS